MLSKMSIGLHVKNPLLLSDLDETCIFSTDIRNVNFTKIRRWEPSCSTRTDERTDRHDEANSRLSRIREHT